MHVPIELRKRIDHLVIHGGRAYTVARQLLIGIMLNTPQEDRSHKWAEELLVEVNTRELSEHGLLRDDHSHV